MNTELFIKKSIDIHGDKYDYSLSVYESPKTKVKIICPHHGIFEQMPYSHMNGNGCPHCAKEKEPYNKRSLDELISLCKERFPEYDYSKSTEDILPKMVVICPKHGEFTCLYRTFTKGAGCPKCYYENLRKPKPIIKSHKEKFIEKAKAKYGDQYDYSFVGDEPYQKETFICNIHNVKFQQTRGQHLKGACGCHMCAKKNLGAPSLGNNEFLKRMKELYGNDYIFDEPYINNRQEMTVICKKHGEFKQSVVRLLKGSGCPDCSNEKQILKRHQNFIKRSNELYGNKYDYSLVEYKGNTTYIKIICKEHGIFEKSPISFLQGAGCPECSGAIQFSKEESKIFNWFPDVFERNDRTVLNGKELDLYSVKHKLAIEVNGIYWHSDEFKDKDYHLNKTEECMKQNISLLHFWDYEINKRQDIVKSMISSRLGLNHKIYGRQCLIKEVSSKEAKPFLANNHIQGASASSVNYGLYYNDELVAIMTFGKSRFNKKYDWELIRYCSKIGTNVIGGASKLFKHFLKNHDGSIVSYANRRYSNGNLYHTLGFRLTNTSKPNYVYFKNGEMLSRIKCQKHKLKTFLENYDDDLSETENMKNNGYTKIYDCGNYVFVYER